MSVLGNAKTPQQAFRQTFNQPNMGATVTDQLTVSSRRQVVNTQGIAKAGVVGNGGKAVGPMP